VNAGNTSITSGTISSTRATFVYARAYSSAVNADFSTTYTTTGDLTEIADGASGAAGAGNEAVHMYVAQVTFTNGPRTVSWGMSPSSGTYSPDAARIVVSFP
jgi:hypothetical protein